MKKNDPWISTLFSLIFIAIPMLIIYYFLLPSWTGKIIINYMYMWCVAFGFVVYVLFLSFIGIKFKIISIESLNFNVPLTLSLVSIILTYPLSIYLMFTIVLLCILTAIPVNILTHRWIAKKKQ